MDRSGLQLQACLSIDDRRVVQQSPGKSQNSDTRITVERSRRVLKLILIALLLEMFLGPRTGFTTLFS
jgi:hypothetical protein